MYPAARLERFGVSTNWLLYTDAEGLDARGIKHYRACFTEAELNCMIPLFQLEKNREGRLVPLGVVQNVNRLLRKTRSLREIAIWWIATHDLISDFSASNGQPRQDVSPRTALGDARLRECLIGAANQTVARDELSIARKVPRLALT